MSKPKQQCPYCNRWITNNNFERHTKSCQNKKSKNKIKISTLKTINNKYECPYCNKLYSKNGIATHIWRVHGEGQSHNPCNYLKGKPNARRGWTKETHPEIIKQNRKTQETMKKKREAGWVHTPHFTEEFLKTTSERMSLHNPGGKTKWFEVAGIKVQGTYEKYFAEILLKNNINWIRPKITFQYKDEQNKTHRYSPDFYLPDLEMYIEIKGYWWGNDKQKMKWVFRDNPQLRKHLKILFGINNIKNYLSKLCGGVT